MYAFPRFPPFLNDVKNNFVSQLQFCREELLSSYQPTHTGTEREGAQEEEEEEEKKRYRAKSKETAQTY